MARSTPAALDVMARHAIPSDKACGVAMNDIKAPGRQLGRNQEPAAALWDTGVYEARMLASFVGGPRGLAFIEGAAGDGRNFVKKAVNMALRATGKRNPALNAAAAAAKKRLAHSADPAARKAGR